MAVRIECSRTPGTPHALPERFAGALSAGISLGHKTPPQESERRWVAAIYRKYPFFEEVRHRFSSRPDFVALICPCPNGKKTESYPLQKHSPPTFIANAKDGNTAPVAFDLAIDQKFKELGVVEELFLVETGGQMAFHHSVSQGPGAKWPEALSPWLKKIGMLK